MPHVSGPRDRRNPQQTEIKWNETPYGNLEMTTEKDGVDERMESDIFVDLEDWE